MELCPKCQQQNPETAQFCTRCHHPLRCTCPACGHVQAHGDKCDACDVDFLEYGTRQLARMKLESDRERERLKGCRAALRQLAMVLLTDGVSLAKLLVTRLRDQ